MNLPASGVCGLLAFATSFIPRWPHRTSYMRSSLQTSAPVAVASDSRTVAPTGGLESEAAHIVMDGTSPSADIPSMEESSMTLADIDEIVQLVDEFDLADFRIENDGIKLEITRPGGKGFEDGKLRQSALPQTQTVQYVNAPPAQVELSAAANGAVSDIEDGMQFEDDADGALDVEADVEAEDPKHLESNKLGDPAAVFESDFVVTSNRVGYFYSGARNKPPLVNVGDHVAFNQPVCIIEQLGQQYVYLSEVSGTVTKIFVEDGDAVQFAQQVMVIRPD